MAKQPGRLCLIKKNGTAIAGLLTNSMTVNGEPIVTTDKGDNGYVSYLADVFTGQQIEITAEGYEEDQVLRDLGLGAPSGKFLSDITYEFANGDEISGDFVLVSYGETAPDEEGERFNATFRSDGAWTFTQAV